jgi:hypothetical protein
MKKIYINLESIKKNEDAGSTSFTALTHSDITFKSTFLPDDFIDGENIEIESYTVCADERSYSGKILDQSLFEKYSEKKLPGLTFIFRNYWETINHLPTPEYSFEYEKIKCSVCKTGVYESDYDEFLNVDFFECDNCDHKLFESDYELETIDEALIRLNDSKLICPKCKNEENFHENRDYSKKEQPVTEIICNECGTIIN